MFTAGVCLKKKKKTTSAVPNHPGVLSHTFILYTEPALQASERVCYNQQKMRERCNSKLKAK